MPPDRHPKFYSAQRFTLNLTRAEMIAAGWSPSVRLFEAAACSVPIIGDAWPGLGEFFHAGSEILVAADSQDVVSFLMEMPEEERRVIGQAARRRVLASHTAACRAKELEACLLQICRPAEFTIGDATDHEHIQIQPELMARRRRLTDDGVVGRGE
jgi:spore maturation protein CgeB